MIFYVDTSAIIIIILTLCYSCIYNSPASPVFTRLDSRVREWRVSPLEGREGSERRGGRKEAGTEDAARSHRLSKGEMVHTNERK